MVELALVLPVMLLFLGAGIDFGRVYLGWISLTGAARVAANFAAMNPTAWSSTEPNTALQAQYTALVLDEASHSGCTLDTSISTVPGFPSGTDIGSPAQVALHCNFSLITPLLGSVLPNPVAVTAAAGFPIRSGIVQGTATGTMAPVATATPTPSPSATPLPTATPTLAPGATPTPVPTATPTPAPTPTPSPAMCIVPVLSGHNSAQAQKAWTDAGFKTDVVFKPVTPPQYGISSQTLPAYTTYPCDTTGIQVSNQ